MANPSGSENLPVAQAFAAALDGSDFATTRSSLAADCVYVCRGERYEGVDVILEQYRQTDDWGRRNLDEIVYESAVRMEADGRARIGFVDHLRHGAARHTFRCEQLLRFNRHNQIQQIEHVDLPGEKVALDEFLAACGLSKG